MDLSTSTKKNIESWLDGPYDENTKNEIKKLLKENPHEIIDSFCKTLDFGTGGIREKMGIGTNRLNIYTISFATQALANYIKSLNIKNPSVVIGYDSRENSKEFANVSARVLLENNIKVFLFDELRPTPLISFALKNKNATSAIMITASHNPKEYNGYKVYWTDGGQVLPPHDVGIIEEYNKIQCLKDVKIAKDLNSNLLEILKDEIDKAYFDTLLNMHFFKDRNKKDLKIIYSNLHGTGITLLPEALKRCNFTDIELVEKQKSIDGKFEFAKKPNPEEKEALSLGIDQMMAKNFDIFIATDPDADRVGIVVNHKKNDVILNGNEIGCIILDYVLKNSKLFSKTASIKSIVTTELMTRITEKYDTKMFDVLTGFKYIAEKINNFEQDNSYEFIFGAEESCGYLIETFVRDKDAISAALIISYIAQDLKKQNKTLVDYLFDLYKEHGIYREKQKSISFAKTSIEDGMEKMDKIMETLRNHPMDQISNCDVNFIDDYLKSITLDTKTKKTKPLDLPKSNVLRFWLDDNTKIVIRPSGTEPKVKIYVGAQENNISNLEKDIKIVDERVNAFLDDICLRLDNIN
ncbi:MAG: Phosphoglucomutase [Candidatus Anoxychlamydiales bacterium]|nr:Phosphoglucomutase [Candidatus Anoxychlamydiales bacterium]